LIALVKVNGTNYYIGKLVISNSNNIIYLLFYMEKIMYILINSKTKCFYTLN